MQYFRSTWSCLRSVTLYAAMVLLVSGCASSGHQKLVIDTREVPAVENLPKEIKAMLEDMGYEGIPESDAKRWARNFNDYKMQFKARNAENIRIDVDFRLLDKQTGIHLYNNDEKTPGAATIRRYDELKKRVEWEFGADSVK